MDRLVALPIKGESFLMERFDRTVLVDGGYSSKSLASVFGMYFPKIDKIDIVVCTHADSDHASGLKEIIDETGFNVGEFWLPGKWIDSIEELLLTPRVVADGLLSELDNISNQFSMDALEHEEIASEIDNLVIQKRRISKRNRGEPRPETDNNRFEKLRDHASSLDEFNRQAKRAFSSARQRIKYRAKGQISQALMAYWLDLIDTAENIRSIAEQAIKHNVRVRWFDFDAFERTGLASGGDTGFLEPLNSVESAPPPLINLSYLAKLSQVNEECLAFVSPSDLGEFGVVFCGDSPMGTGAGYGNSIFAGRTDDSHCLPVIATAPHHGSESNAMAYQHVDNWSPVATWLRTGGSRSQPGRTYKGLPLAKRTCSYCPQTSKKLGLTEILLSYDLYRPYCFFSLVKLSPHRCDCV